MLDPDGPRWYLYIIFSALVLLSGYFASAETAYSYCNKFKLKVCAENKEKRAIVALAITDKFDKALTTVMIGNNLLHIAASVLGSLLMIEATGSEAIGSVVATVVTTLSVFVFGETIPKNIAKANCDSFALGLAYITRALIVILTPVSIIFLGLIALMKKVLKISEDEPALTEDDFSDIIESVEEEGVLDADESGIIQAAVDFDDTAVKDVLTKAADIVAIDVNMDRDSLISFLANGKYSRYPVYERDIDHIIGTLHFRTFAKLIEKNPQAPLREALNAPYKVPATVTLDDMFEGFKVRKSHIAIVTDAEGKTLGMVTMEDVLEELVADISEPPVTGGSV